MGQSKAPHSGNPGSPRQWLWRVTKISEFGGQLAGGLTLLLPLPVGTRGSVPTAHAPGTPSRGRLASPSPACVILSSLLCADSGRAVQRPPGNKWQRQIQAQACLHPKPMCSLRAGRGARHSGWPAAAPRGKARSPLPLARSRPAHGLSFNHTMLRK